jgi:antitoxin (DNA-binding transcriptional repressor) of toxin-antitoxin stability system
MKVFNTREAREHMRESLDAVEQGEVIGIKRRGHLIARLIPAEDKQSRFSRPQCLSGQHLIYR